MAILVVFGIGLGAGIAIGTIGYRMYLRSLYDLQRKIHRVQRGGK